jgi:DNA polymerase
MDWSIFTPKGCAHWNGTALTHTPGIPNNPVENPDALEAAWRTYYRSIFNPARLKVKAMQTEMPKRYWKNLPEAELIEELIGQSQHRVTQMFAEEPRAVKPTPKNAYLDKLRELSAKEQSANRAQEAEDLL